jgi:hypothetical protein
MIEDIIIRVVPRSVSSRSSDDGIIPSVSFSALDSEATPPRQSNTGYFFDAGPFDFDEGPSRELDIPRNAPPSPNMSPEELDLFFKNKYKENGGARSPPIPAPMLSMLDIDTRGIESDDEVPSSAHILYAYQDEVMRRVEGVRERGVEIAANAWDLVRWGWGLPRRVGSSLFEGWL